MEDKKDDRKISDIILDMELKINSILQIAINFNNNVVITLARMNELSSKFDRLLIEESGTVLNEETGSVEPIPVAQDLIGQRRATRVEAVLPKSENKIAVFQKATDQGGKLIFMADVEVISEDNSIALKTRTTASGNWQGPLKPGNYTVNILKRENSGKKKLEYKKIITIPDGESPFELEIAKLS